MALRSKSAGSEQGSSLPLMNARSGSKDRQPHSLAQLRRIVLAACAARSGPLPVVLCPWSLPPFVESFFLCLPVDTLAGCGFGLMPAASFASRRGPPLGQPAARPAALVSCHLCRLHGAPRGRESKASTPRSAGVSPPPGAGIATARGSASTWTVRAPPAPRCLQRPPRFRFGHRRVRGLMRRQ